MPEPAPDPTAQVEAIRRRVTGQEPETAIQPLQDRALLLSLLDSDALGGEIFDAIQSALPSAAIVLCAEEDLQAAVNRITESIAKLAPDTQPIDPVKTRGLHRKFKVERVDPEAQERHKDCATFVLEPKHDLAARNALITYAEACGNDYPELAADLRNWVAAENRLTYGRNVSE